MKRALSVATVTALSLLLFLFIGYAQEEGAPAVSTLLEQELTAMEAAFGGLEAFMAELITEVKGNMGDIGMVTAEVDHLRNMVMAVSVEIKSAEASILGLRQDVNALGSAQQELKVRIVALEAGLSELSAFAEDLKAQLDVTGSDLGILREEFDALTADYALFAEAFEVFRNAVYGDIDALRNSIYADLGMLEQTLNADITVLQAQFLDVIGRVQALEDEDVGTFKKKVLDLERSMAAVAIRIDNNRAKLEGFDHAIAGISAEMVTTREGILEANQALMGEYDARLLALEGIDIKPQLDTVYFISIVALLAGVGALIWGFLGPGG